MGRRKIEIQPITHERNRSVTFLKRKNGLFKKAYELGVLCSVDVAVIIFEERPGHHLKLYQYGSTDIHDIVQRHIRYDGEKDTRSPSDFSGASGKLDDAVDGDDDDMDDDDEPAPPRASAGVKRRGDGKAKPDGGKAIGNLPADNNQHRPMTIPPPPMPLYPSHSTPSGSGASSSHPVSGERLSSSSQRVSSTPSVSANHSAPNKKARITPNVNISGVSRSSSDENGASGSYGFAGSSASHISQANIRHSQSHSSAYNGFFPGQSQNSNYISNGFDFSHPTSSSRGPPPRSNYSPSGPPFRQQHNDSGNFQQVIRHPPNRQQAAPSTDLFAAFLDSDGSRQTQPQSQSFSTLDWPVHGSSQQTSGPGQHVHQESGAAQHPGPADTNWLDFLSSGSTATQSLLSAPPGAAAREAMSWERGQDGEVFGTDTRSGTGRPASRSGAASANSHTNRSRISSGANSGLEDEGGGDAQTTAGSTNVRSESGDPVKENGLSEA